MIEYERKYYESGKIRHEIPKENGKIHGTVKVWNEEGILIRSVEFCDGLNHGAERDFDDTTGSLIGERFYNNGKRIGEAKQWFDEIVLDDPGYLSKLKEAVRSGDMEFCVEKPRRLKKLTTYDEDGNIRGIEKEWYQNGKLAYECPYVNGVKHGILKSWFLEGFKNKLENYVNGLLQGAAYEWGRAEEKWRDFNYKNGKLEGKQISYRGDTYFRSEQYYVNGLEHGLRIDYDKNYCIINTFYFYNGNEITEEEYRQYQLIEELAGLK